ncbi:MAG: hypothetical protein LBS84_05495 [Clostridiales bacterium]|jgi:hypothetical protein|nr:hypothetical protein [Clostridiales bacterium]
MPYDTLNTDFLVKQHDGTYKKFNFSTIAEIITLTNGNTVQMAITALETAVSGATALTVVDTIAERDAIDNPAVGVVVLVKDASDDPTVTAGWAKYLWDGEDWLKTAEGESIDLNLVWSAISGRPSSSSAAIDQAVLDDHIHSNKATLDKISEVDGAPQYNGTPIQLGPMVAISTTEPTDQPEGGLWFKPISE